MMLFRSAITLALLAAGLVTPAHADHTDPTPVDRSDVPVLKGENTIFGDQTAWTRVRLPESLHWDEIDTWPKVRGDGRVIGIFLIEENGGQIDPKGQRLWMVGFGNCSSRACDGTPGWGPDMGWKLDKEDMVPAGLYRLYLIVDGASGSVSFEIPRLSGATRINPTQTLGRARVKVQTLKTHLYESTTGVAFSAGNEAPFGGSGLALQKLWIDPLGTGAVESGVCWYRREAPADPQLAYLPPECMVGLLPFVQHYAPPNDGCCLGTGMSLDYLPKAMGSWYISTGPVESSGATALWLKLN